MPMPQDYGNNQDAVYWERVGTDENRQPTVTTNPIQLEVGWDETRRQDTAPDGTVISTDVTVTGVDFLVQVGSAMALGRVNDLLGPNQTPAIDAFRVVSVRKKPDPRGAYLEYQLGLVRDANALGQQVDPVAGA